MEFVSESFHAIMKFLAMELHVFQGSREDWLMVEVSPENVFDSSSKFKPHSIVQDSHVVINSEHAIRRVVFNWERERERERERKREERWR
jgi:hypothetical protein